MWEIIAVVSPIILAVNGLLFKRLDDIDRRLTSMPVTYVSRDELKARFDNIDFKLSSIDQRIDMTKEVLQVELDQMGQANRLHGWYASRAPHRKPYEEHPEEYGR